MLNLTLKQHNYIDSTVWRPVSQVDQSIFAHLTHNATYVEDSDQALMRLERLAVMHSVDIEYVK